MRPSLVLRAYFAASLFLGIAVSTPLAMFVHNHELTRNAAAILTLCLNVLLIMVLPLVLDFSERKYFKARFVQLEELAQTNPQLKAVLEEQCQKLSLPGLRLAAVDTADMETLTYGLWRQNPRLVLPASWLQPSALQSSEQTPNIVPSIEVELNRFAKRDLNLVFLSFFLVEVGLQYLATAYWLH